MGSVPVLFEKENCQVSIKCPSITSCIAIFIYLVAINILSHAGIPDCLGKGFSFCSQGILHIKVLITQKKELVKSVIIRPYCQ